MPHKHLTIGERLKRDLDGTHSLVVIETDDEADLRDQLFMAVPENVAYHRWTAVQGLGDARFAAQAFADTEHPAAALAWITLKAPAARALWVFYDLCPHLSDARTLRALKEAVMRVRGVFGSIVLVERSATLPADLEPEVHRIRNPIPTEKELEHIVKAAVRDVGKTRKIQASIRRSTLNAIIRSLRGLSRRQASRVIALSAAEDDRFDDADLERVLLHKRNACSDLGGVLEFVQAPVSMDQIGGLGRLKAWLADRHMGMSDEASRYGLTPPRGMLLLGVQGAGKSLAAKAVATAWQVPLLRLDASALFDKFVGESERKLRESLAQADRMAPAVLWIDEIEKGFASASARLERWWPFAADVRHASHLDAGADGPDLFGGDRQRHLGAATGTPPQGTLRRGLLRGPPESGRAKGDPRNPPHATKALSGGLRPRCSRGGDRSLQRRRDRGRHRGGHAKGVRRWPTRTDQQRLP
jgi:hypothetical protein